MKDSKNSFKKLCRACVPSSASNELINEIQHFQTKQKTSANNKKLRNSNGNTKASHNKKTLDNLHLGTNGLNNQQFLNNNGMNNQPGKIKTHLS